jgi:hypothetical protein
MYSPSSPPSITPYNQLANPTKEYLAPKSWPSLFERVVSNLKLLPFHSSPSLIPNLSQGQPGRPN